jgi:hypothetical protein
VSPLRTPESGTAICPEHGEVRPHLGHPVSDGSAAGSRSADWSTEWSRQASSYRYKAVIHPSLCAKLAPFPTQGGLSDLGFADEPISFVIGFGLLGLAYALTYTPRLLSPRISIDRRRVRFGVRSVRLKHVGSFAVVATKALFALRDELNEALFLVQHQSPRVETRTPYRD